MRNRHVRVLGFILAVLLSAALHGWASDTIKWKQIGPGGGGNRFAMGVSPAIRIGDYFTFFFRMVLAFGVTFELPVFTFFLVRVGVWDYRFMLRSFRYAIVAIFIIAAILTPTPDVINKSLLAIPMLLLYILSIGVAYLWRRSE